jgi:hypothetical protein
MQRAKNAKIFLPLGITAPDFAVTHNAGFL